MNSQGEQVMVEESSALLTENNGSLATKLRSGKPWSGHIHKNLGMQEALDHSREKGFKSMTLMKSYYNKSTNLKSQTSDSTHSNNNTPWRSSFGDNMLSFFV
ncbi:hypothetical protein BDBG_07503 [Blastomyces gilchristii SLH14081]|uniref:Uncharacterized protein n=1 Tax=Blastomyces gilchristii (strain SLH14081) TaxID=559298 RepID=A0A179V0J3_BLAGS|nr:uncharacterized protein BDBG_07503 [Blastomyces gilchristii SLH14081]OAT12112.1 hypothetical protein BDBG_07503 [Blastomyces gilchristii SLH14081]